jgi:uracil-DNA glycosylase
MRKISKEILLRKLNNNLENCQDCKLKYNRKLVIKGEGNPEAKIYL